MSTCPSDDGEIAIGLRRKREFPRLVTAHQPPPHLQASTIRVGPVSSYKGSASRFPGLSFSLQRHLEDGNKSTRSPASSASSCGTPTHSGKLLFSNTMDRYYLGPWEKSNVQSSSHQPYSEGRSSQDFHSSSSLNDSNSKTHLRVLSHPESVNHPPHSYAVNPKISPEHPYPARQYAIMPPYLPTRHVYGVRRPFSRLARSHDHVSLVLEDTYGQSHRPYKTSFDLIVMNIGTHILSSPHEGVCRTLQESPQSSLSPRLLPPFVSLSDGKAVVLRSHAIRRWPALRNPACTPTNRRLPDTLSTPLHLNIADILNQLVSSSFIRQLRASRMPEIGPLGSAAWIELLHSRLCQSGMAVRTLISPPRSPFTRAIKHVDKPTSQGIKQALTLHNRSHPIPIARVDCRGTRGLYIILSLSTTLSCAANVILTIQMVTAIPRLPQNAFLLGPAPTK